MTAGRPQIPMEIKVARGTYRADRDAKTSAIPSIPLVELPNPPDSLEEVGRAKWAEWVDLLVALKLLEKRYLDALEMYCQAWDRLAHYKQVIKTSGEFTTVESGYVCAHPATGLARQARDEIRKYQTEFGFTPSSSSKVSSGKKEKGPAGVPSRRRDLG